MREKENEQDRIRDILKANPKGLTIEEVSQSLSLSRPTTAKYLNALVMSGQADLRELGRAKLFSLTQRVPITKLLSLSTDLILILDADVSIREINEAAIRFFSRDLDELKGKRLEYSPLAPYFSEDLLACVKDALDGKEAFREISFDVLEPDRYFKVKFIPLVFNEGDQGAALILEDITPMKNYQRALEEQVQERTREAVKAKEYAENLIQTANAMIVGLDANGQIILFNHAAEEITGYSQQEILHNNWFEILVPKEKYPHVWEVFEQFSEMGLPQKFENPLLTKHGEERYISWSNTILYEAGNAVATISFGIDITERKLAEDALIESQRALSTLLGNLPGMAFRCRNDETWTMEFVSEGCSELTGYLPSDLVNNYGVSFDQLIHQEDREAVRSTVMAALEKKERYQIQYRILTASGKCKWVWEQGTGVFFGNGDLRSIEGLIIDISDRKNAEELVKRAQKQVALLTRITRHDIINQITALNAYLTRQKKSARDPAVDEMIRKEQVIVETILRQIVFTRDYQNVGAEAPQWVNVQASIQGILRTIDRGSVDIQVHTGSLEIFCDPLIEKVFFNLVENSLRHGGSLRKIQISYVCEKNGLSILFEDDGCGIPADEKELIFTRGYGKNTGYGLFLVREILSMSGFTITETGEPGTGARFIIRVPPEAYRFS